MVKVRIGSSLTGKERGIQRFARNDPNPKIPFVEATMPTPTRLEVAVTLFAALLLLGGYLIG